MRCRHPRQGSPLIVHSCGPLFIGYLWLMLQTGKEMLRSTNQLRCLPSDPTRLHTGSDLELETKDEVFRIFEIYIVHIIEICQENVLVIANTLFEQHQRRLYTWTSPDAQYQNQIDYILCSQRWRSFIHSAKTRPSANCGSDHQLLIAKLILKLKKVGKNQT